MKKLTLSAIVLLAVLPFQAQAQGVEPRGKVYELEERGPQYPLCRVNSEICYYQDKELTRSQLLDYFMVYPARSEEGHGYYCQFESCFSDDGDFLGLNPFYYYR